MDLAKPTHKKWTNTAHHAKHREQVCKNCGKKGHHCRRCKHTKKCLICHEQDHLAAACPTNNSDKHHPPPYEAIATVIAQANTERKSTHYIHLDSACPVHIVNKAEHLSEVRAASTPLSFSSITNSTLPLTQVGMARIQTPQGVIRLEMAYLAKESPVNIISLGELDQKGWEIALQDSPEG